MKRGPAKGVYRIVDGKWVRIKGTTYNTKNSRFIKKILEKKDMIYRRIKDMESEYVIAEKIKNHWELHAAAKKLYSKDKCFICGHRVDWTLNSTEHDGRMFNIDDSKDLLEEYWITICKKCLKRKVLKEILESGI